MDKTIESKFFEAFKWGGVVDKCITWMRYTYNLPKMKPSGDGDNEEKQQSEETSKADEKWDKFYREVLPKEILEATDAFDDTVINFMDSPLMDEIEANLNECQTDAQKERYLFSLLKPFGESPSGCGFADAYTPIAETKYLKDRIKELEKTKVAWQAIADKKQVEACDNMIKRCKEQIEWVLHVNEQFCNLTGKFEDGAKWMQAGTVENCLSAFCDIVYRFANRLDALLLTYGIDLMRLQRESGLYLKSHRIITDIDCYIGSMELTKRYINALPKEPKAVPKQDITEPQPENNTPKVNELTLPSELDTESARKYFAKAIKAGYMQISNGGYKWLFGGNRGQARLGYFCNKVYSNPRPINKLEQIFGVKKLSASISNAEIEAKRADVKKWRDEMNNNIFND